MEKERTEMSEVDFITKYETSRVTLLKLMWPCPHKVKISKPKRQPLPIEEINRLRITMSDTEIAEQYSTYSDNIVKQCWSRKSLGIKQIVYKKDEYKTRSIAKHTETRGLKQDRWETPEPTSYELSWMEDAVEIGTNPISTLYEKISCK